MPLRPHPLAVLGAAAVAFAAWVSLDWTAPPVAPQVEQSAAEPMPSSMPSARLARPLPVRVTDTTEEIGRQTDEEPSPLP